MEYGDRAIEAACIELHNKIPQDINEEYPDLRLLSGEDVTRSSAECSELEVEEGEPDQAAEKTVEVNERQALSIGPFEPGVACEFLEATYGWQSATEKKIIDVTEKIRERWDSERGLKISSAGYNKLFGINPAFWKIKTLKVTYRLHNVRQWDVSSGKYAEAHKMMGAAVIIKREDEKLTGTIGQYGEVVDVDNSNMPIKVQLNDGVAWWYKEEWLQMTEKRAQPQGAPVGFAQAQVSPVIATEAKALGRPVAHKEVVGELGTHSVPCLRLHVKTSVAGIADGSTPLAEAIANMRRQKHLAQELFDMQVVLLVNGSKPPRHPEATDKLKEDMVVYVGSSKLVEAVSVMDRHVITSFAPIFEELCPHIVHFARLLDSNFEVKPDSVQYLVCKDILGDDTDKLLEYKATIGGLDFRNYTGLSIAGIALAPQEGVALNTVWYPGRVHRVRKGDRLLLASHLSSDASNKVGLPTKADFWKKMNTTKDAHALLSNHGLAETAPSGESSLWKTLYAANYYDPTLWDDLTKAELRSLGANGEDTIKFKKWTDAGEHLPARPLTYKWLLAAVPSSRLGKGLLLVAVLIVIGAMIMLFLNPASKKKIDDIASFSKTITSVTTTAKIAIGCVTTLPVLRMRARR